jgi:histidinol-phosphate aminotransferase
MLAEADAAELGMSFDVRVPEHVGKVPPYQPGRAMASVSREFGLKLGSIVKLASNENPLGMSPLAQASLQRLLDDPARYPDSDAVELREKLAARHHVPVEWVTVGSGSAEILQLAAHSLLAANRSSVSSQYAFTSYVRETRAIGARAIVAPAKAYGHDPAAFLAAIADDTSLIYIANPNNPTGTYLPPDVMSDFLASVPSHVAVVLDEAYFDFLDEAERPDSIAWARRHPNVIVARTFSKIYGMAGLRVGYAIAQAQMTEILNRLRLTFNVSTYAQTAAIAALDDEAFVTRSRTATWAGMQTLTRAFDNLRLPYVPSKGNFVMVRVGDATRVNAHLLREGVIVRPVANYGLPEWLRITVGLPEENERFLASLSGARQAIGELTS